MCPNTTKVYNTTATTKKLKLNSIKLYIFEVFILTILYFSWFSESFLILIFQCRTPWDI
jgi:hypothetical protein